MGAFGASILALISYWSTFYLCTLPAFSDALLLHSFCSWPQWKKNTTSGRDLNRCRISIHRDSFQRGFQDRKETNSKNSSQQKWNVLKIIQKSARLQTSLGTQIEIFVKPPPSHTRVKTLLALRFATSRVNPMSSFSRAIMRLDLQIGAATSSGDDCWGSGTCPAQKSILRWFVP